MFYIVAKFDGVLVNRSKVMAGFRLGCKPCLNMLENTFGFESVILGIYCLLESVRYWADLAEL